MNKKMDEKMNVLIIGAGVAGLTSLKECLAKGYQAVLFEAAGECGGQWRYMEPDPATGDVHSSMYHGIIMNSCRDTSAFCDFPLDPKRYPRYFGHAGFLTYLEEYSTFFNLHEHIKYNTKVLKSEQTLDGGWKVSYEQNGAVQTEIYDALFACTGHVWNPNIPKFEGLSDFMGTFHHSHVYRTPAPYEGKKVAIIGFGSSAVDIASEISPQAKECHFITRTGGWIIPRFLLGNPIEAYNTRILHHLPSSLFQSVLTHLINLAEGKVPAGLRPKHRLFEASLPIRGDFLEKVNVGLVTPHRSGIERFTSDGILLTNGTKLEVDTIVFCTGYNIDYPYLPLDSYLTKNNKNIDASTNPINLYELVVSPKYQNLFFIGLIESPGPNAQIFETQARWAVAVLSGEITLPKPTEMEDWAKNFATRLLGKPTITPKGHIRVGSNVSYIDRLTEPLRANPSFTRLLGKVFTSSPLRALSILYSVYVDVTTSSQFRLFGEGACYQLSAATILRIARGGEELSHDEKMALEHLKAEWDRKELKMHTNGSC